MNDAAYNETLINSQDDELVTGAVATDAPETPPGQELIYYSDEDTDVVLQKIVDMLRIDPFNVECLAVKRSIGGRRFDGLFNFAPSEMPISDRVRRDHGPGAYEIWIYQNKKIHKRLKLNIREGEGGVGNSSHQQNYQAQRNYQVPRNRQDPANHRSHGRGTGGGERSDADSGLRQEINSLKSQVSQMRNRGGSQSSGSEERNTAKEMGEIFGVFREMGLVSPVKSSPAPVEQQKSFEEALEERISSSKKLGFERPEGGAADMSDGSGFFDSEFAFQALTSLSGVVGAAIQTYQMSVLNKRDELRMANGLPPMHLGDPVDASPKEKPPAPSVDDEKNPYSVENPSKPEQEASEGAQKEDKGGIFMGNLDDLHVHLMFLVSMAEGEAETDHWAGCTLDMFDDEILDNTILKDGALDLILAKNPKLAKHKPWFEQYLVDMKRQIREINEHEEECRMDNELINENVAEESVPIERPQEKEGERKVEEETPGKKDEVGYTFS